MPPGLYIFYHRQSFCIILAFLDPKLRNPSVSSSCKLPTHILLCDCFRRVRSLKGGCYSTMALHHHHFVNLTLQSTLHLQRNGGIGLHRYLIFKDYMTDFHNQNFKKTQSKYHLFNISVLLWQPHESWWILFPLGVRNSLRNNTGSQICWTAVLKLWRKKCNLRQKEVTEHSSANYSRCRYLLLAANRRVQSTLQRGQPPAQHSPLPWGWDRAPPAPHCSFCFLAVSPCLLMIKQILGIPLFKEVVKVAELTGLLQRTRWSLYLRHSHWAGCNFSSGPFEIFLFHSRISD